MKTLKEICEGFFNEGFFNNVGSTKSALWLSKLKCANLDDVRCLWTKEYLYEIDGSKLILIHDNDKCIFDFAKGLLWTSFVKFCDPADEYVFTFEPYHGQIWFKLVSKKRLGSRPAVFIYFDMNLNVYKMKIFNKELLGIDDKLYKSGEGYTADGVVHDPELIKYFIR